MRVAVIVIDWVNISYASDNTVFHLEGGGALGFPPPLVTSFPPPPKILRNFTII